MPTERIVQEIVVTGDEAARKQIEALGAASDKTMAKSAAAAGGASKSFGELEGATEGLHGALEALSKRLVPLAGEFNEVADVVRKFGGTMSIAAAAVVALTGGLFEVARRSSEAASAIKEASTRAGTSAKNFQEMSFAFRQSGSSAEALEKGMAIILDAAEKGGDAAKPFEKLGIALTELGKARDPIDVMRDIADKMAEIPDPTQRAQIAISLFGRRVGTQFVEPLQDGSKGIDELIDKLKKIGGVLSPAELAVGKEFSDTMDRLGTAASATATKVGLAFVPMFDPLIESLSKMIGAIQPSLVAAAHAVTEFLKPVFDDIAAAFSGSGDKIKSQFIKVVVDGFKGMGAVIGEVSKEIGSALGGLKTVVDGLTAAFNGLFGTKLTSFDLVGFAIGARLAATALRLLAGAVIFLTRAVNPWMIAISGVLALLAILNDNISPEQWKALGAAIANIGPTITNAIAGMGNRIKQLWNDALTFIGDKTSAVMTAVAGFFKPVTGAVASALEGVKQLWADALKWIGDKASAALAAVGGLWPQVTDALGGVLTRIKQAWAAAWAFVSDKASAALAAVGGFFAPVTDAVASALDGIKQLWADGWNWIQQKADAALTAVAGFFKPVIDKFTGAIDSIKQLWADGWNWIQQKADAALTAVAGFFKPVIDALDKALQLAKQFADALGGAGAPAGAASVTAAGGGHVRGPGSSTSDSIWARLSNNEYVLRAAAVRKYGTGFLDALNRMAVPLAGGGLASPVPMPRLAMEGTSARRVAVDLSIMGEHFNDLLAPEDVADKLVTFAIRRQTRSTGRRPAWVR